MPEEGLRAMDSINRKALFVAEGVVQKGQQKGGILGYPTANIPCDGLVSGGIYAGEIEWKGIRYPAALYKEDGKNILEAHLLDFQGDVYGTHIIISAYQKVRDVKRFSSEEELIAAIKKDVNEVRSFFGSMRNILIPND